MRDFGLPPRMLVSLTLVLSKCCISSHWLSLPQATVAALRCIFAYNAFLFKFGSSFVYLRVEPVDKKRRRYKSNFLRHVTRMNNNRMPKITLNCVPDWRRRLGRPSKRLFHEAESGLSRPTREGWWWWWWCMDFWRVVVTLLDGPQQEGTVPVACIGRRWQRES